jgi:hypothetical protein
MSSVRATSGDHVSQDLTQPNFVREIAGSCCDCRHPASNVAKQDSSFWISCGMFPHYLVIEFSEPVVISRVEIKCANVGKLEIASSRDGDSFDDDELVCHAFPPESPSRRRVWHSKMFAVPSMITKRLTLTIIRGGAEGEHAMIRQLVAWGDAA